MARRLREEVNDAAPARRRPVADGTRLCGAREAAEDLVHGRNYAHLVLRDAGGRKLSVFAEAARRGRLPWTHQSPRKGFVTAGASTSGHQVFVVSDSGVSPPPGVASELMRSTLAFVKTLPR